MSLFRNVRFDSFDIFQIFQQSSIYFKIIKDKILLSIFYLDIMHQIWCLLDYESELEQMELNLQE